MGLKKISAIVTSVVIVGAIFTGCGTKKIDLKVNVNDAYSTKMNKRIEVISEGQSSSIETKLDQDVVYRLVSEDKINAEAELKGISMIVKSGDLSLNFNKDDPQFKDEFKGLDGYKTLTKMNGIGEVFGTEVLSGESNLLKLSGEEIKNLNSAMNKFLVDNINKKIKKGQKVETSLSAIAKKTIPNLDGELEKMLKEEMVQGEVVSIEDNIATMEYKLDSFKKEQYGSKIDIGVEMTTKVNVKTGITEHTYVKLNIKQIEVRSKIEQYMTITLKLDATKK